MQRISQIEGIRAYLAMWVLVCHVLGSSGYDDRVLSGPMYVLRHGQWAVDLFMVVSGFVIFFLIDHRREPYGTFIIRRFFRLWPLFMLLFLASIPLSLVQFVNRTEAPFPFQDTPVHVIVGWWQHIWGHIAAHLFMLHGLGLDAILPVSALAFLPAAWSISLEWQFYLIAPAIFRILQTRSGALLLISTLAVWLWLRVSPPVENGFLPYSAEFFAIGIGLHFVWKKWPGAFRHFRFVSPAFTNRTAQYLGKISYSIYLSHELVIILMQRMLLEFSPGLSQPAHFFALLLLTVPATVALSHVLYERIERPGIRFGARVSKLKWFQSFANAPAGS